MTAIARAFGHLGLAAAVIGAAVIVAVPVAAPTQAAPGENLCSAPASTGASVIRKFCDGPATLQLTLNGKARAIKGGQCDHQMGMRSFNAGMVSIDHAVSGGPNYIGFTLPDDASTPSLTIHLDGKKYLFQTKTGSITDKGGMFDGVGSDIGPAHTNVTVHGSFICK